MWRVSNDRRLAYGQRLIYGEGRWTFYIFNRHFFENEHMHFGYWEPGLELKYLNLKQAQCRYVEEFFKLVPADVQSVLDVGCGSGEMAKELIGRGYQVDCVCPPTIVSQFAKAKLGEKTRLFVSTYEELDIPQRFDLVYFSESFQFIKTRAALEQSRRYAAKYVLIGDVFRRDTPDRGPIGGGHRYSTYKRLVDQLGFEEIEDVDVTEFIAPNFDLEAQMLRIVEPLAQVSQRMLSGYKLALAKLLMLPYRGRINRLKQRYLGNSDRNARSFAEYKTYRFILLKPV